MTKYQSTLNLIGRIAIAALFLPAGIQKLMEIEGTTGYFRSLGLPAFTLLVWVVIAIEIFGSVALILGYKTRFVAVGLAIFTLGASIVGHPFWAAPQDAVFIAQLLFVKNIAILGGLLVLASSGSGAFSLDARNSKS
ncbi:DoxX family protein [Polynucleobacter sp. AP-Latsch-80-C2]|jgi:putative oxidoreductase|uniref:DoxX family protein n=1 Tax=Polynucleobacter sp. AP-Latsch-80-C2 TaxID=2576931 RepID=UPI001C0C12AE|nr:DoxX family protein [Polynucleobacter sp. AP-Latsch-80-C2]MBU3623602.1 DoxX family protein [Polynucleobacter sp. AP-Latsch-80-C2]